MDNIKPVLAIKSTHSNLEIQVVIRGIKNNIPVLFNSEPKVRFYKGDHELFLSDEIKDLILENLDLKLPAKYWVLFLDEDGFVIHPNVIILEN